MAYHILAIDCDDVLVETAPLIINNYNKTYGTDLRLQDMYSHDLKRWGVQEAGVAIGRVEKYLDTDEYRGVQPFRDAIKVIRQLGERYELHLVTARNQILEMATKDMLETYFPDLFTSVQFTGAFTATPRTKADVCKELHADLLIDDQLANALSVAQSGIDVFLFGAYPWNQTLELLPANIQRVTGWNEITKLLVDGVAPRTQNQSVLKEVDSILMRVPSIEAGLTFYMEKLHMELMWKSDDMALLRLGNAGLVLSTIIEPEVEFIVDSVNSSVEAFEQSGGTIISSPEHIRTGQIAIVEDPFGNKLTLLDFSGDTHPDESPREITGVEKIDHSS